MKKLFLIATFVCLLNIVGNAGWADSMRQPCDPKIARPGTCFYYDDDNGGGERNADTTLTYIKALIAEYNPFVFLLK